MSRIFLSYSNKDTAQALALLSWLGDNGWKDEVFLDFDPQRFGAAERWQRALHAAALRCEAVLVLISKAWLESARCRSEFELALSLNKRIFGVLIEDLPPDQFTADVTDNCQVARLVPALPDYFNIRVVIPTTAEQTIVRFFTEGLQRLRFLLDTAGLAPTSFTWPPLHDSHDPNRQPYPGLRPFDVEDAGIFFGRDAPIVEVLDQLRGLRRSRPPRLLVIRGAAGVGKSSFMRAGLLSRLLRDEHSFFPLPMICPHRSPINGEGGLVSALDHALYGDEITDAELQRVVEGGFSTLRPLLKRIVGRAGPSAADEHRNRRPPTLILCIDQAEKLFSGNQDEAQALLALLRDLLMAEELALIVVVAISSDFYAHLEGTKLLEGIRPILIDLHPVPRSDYPEIIKGPAGRLERPRRPLIVEDSLVDALIEDIQANAANQALALLAFTLARLYFHSDGSLTLADYRSLGGISAAVAAVEPLSQAAAGNAAPFELSEFARRWVNAGRPGPQGLLLRSPSLEKAEVWLASRPLDALEPPEAIRSYVAMSRAAIQAEEATKQNEMNRYLVTQSRLLANISRKYADEQDCAAAADLALEALPQEGLGSLRPYIPDAEVALYKALWGLRESGLMAAPGTRFPSVKFAPDGMRLLAWDGQLASISNLEGPRQVVSLHGHTDEIIAATFSHDGKSLATTCRNGTIHIWDALTGKPRQILRHKARGFAPPPSVTSPSFDPKTRHLAVIVEGKARIWDLRNEIAPLYELEFTGRDQLTALLFTSERRILVAANMAAHTRVLLWDGLATGKTKTVADLDGEMNGAVFSPDGKYVAVRLRKEDSIAVCELSKGTKHFVIEGIADVACMAFSHDSNFLVVAPRDKTARVWNVAQKALATTLRGHLSNVTGASFNPLRHTAATASSDGTIRFWTLGNTPMRTERFPRFAGAAVLSFSPDCSKALVCAENLQVRNANTGTVIATLKTPTESSSQLKLDALFSPDGQTVATWWRNSPIFICDTTDGRQISVFQQLKAPGEIDGIVTAAFNIDGTRICTVGLGMLYIWDACRGLEIAKVKTYSDSVCRIAFNPNSGLIIAASYDGTARIRDAKTGHPLELLRGHTASVLSGRFSSDGRFAVTAGADGRVLIWSSSTWEVVKELRIQDAEINDAAFSPDGRRLMTISSDKIARVWDIQAGEPIAVIEQTTCVKEGFFDPEGTSLITIGEDWTFRKWRIFSETSDLTKYARNIVPRVLTLEQRQSEFLDPEPPFWSVEMSKWPYDGNEWKIWMKDRRTGKEPPAPNADEGKG